MQREQNKKQVPLRFAIFAFFRVIVENPPHKIRAHKIFPDTKDQNDHIALNTTQISFYYSLSKNSNTPANHNGISTST